MKMDIKYYAYAFLMSYPMRLLKKLEEKKKIDAIDPRDELCTLLLLLDKEEDKLIEQQREQAETTSLSDIDSEENAVSTSDKGEMAI